MYVILWELQLLMIIYGILNRICINAVDTKVYVYINACVYENYKADCNHFIAFFFWRRQIFIDASYD